MVDGSTDGSTNGSPAGEPGMWTLIFDDGTVNGLRVVCPEEKVAEYILSRRATASTQAIAPGATERVPLGRFPKFAALFSAGESDAIARTERRTHAESLRMFAMLCRICAYFFVVIGVIWLIAALAGGIKVDGARGFMGMVIAGLLGVIPMAAVPVLFFTLAALAEGMATLLNQSALRQFRTP